MATAVDRRVAFHGQNRAVTQSFAFFMVTVPGAQSDATLSILGQPKLGPEATRLGPRLFSSKGWEPGVTLGSKPRIPGETWADNGSFAAGFTSPVRIQYGAIAYLKQVFVLLLYSGFEETFSLLGGFTMIVPGD